MLVARIDRRFSKMKERLIKKLEKAKYVAISADCWKTFNRLCRRELPGHETTCGRTGYFTRGQKHVSRIPTPHNCSTETQADITTWTGVLRAAETAVIAGLEKRFGDKMRDTPLVVSAVLLPRFKMQWIAEAQRGMITQLMKDEGARLPQNVEPSTKASPESAETSAEDFFGFEDFGYGQQGERCGASQELAR
ncbi:hypothetical protein ISCGN_031854 [Ixodes scapularis]